MKSIRFIGIGTVLVALFVVIGCNRQQEPSPKKGSPSGKDNKEKDHSHGAGPHGGTVTNWGGGKYHVEFTVDHGKQEATVYVLGSDAKKPAPVKADKLLLSIKDPVFQVELKAVPQEGEQKGTSSRFVGKHERLGKEQEFAETISGEVDGKPYAGDFKEKPESPTPPKK